MMPPYAGKSLFLFIANSFIVFTSNLTQWNKCRIFTYTTIQFSVFIKGSNDENTIEVVVDEIVNLVKSSGFQCSLANVYDVE